jgi:hypothetical protein
MLKYVSNFEYDIKKNEGRNSSVGMATDYGLDGRLSIPDKGKIFTFSPRLLLCPPGLLSRGYREAFPWGYNFKNREAGYSPPSSAEVKNG